MQRQTTETAARARHRRLPSRAATLPYPIVDAGQTACYDASAEIAPPAPGADFYGQDAQYAGNQPSYTMSADGLTVTDNVTGLMWQQTPDTNGDGVINYGRQDDLGRGQAYPPPSTPKKFGGYDDWRLPTHQGALLAHPVRRHRPQPHGHRHLRAGPLHRHRLLRFRLRRHRRRESASSTRSTPPAPCTSRRP